MIDHDKAQFQSLMLGVGEVYGKEITKALLQIYFQTLQSYSIDVVSDAFTQHLSDPKQGSFMPKPADIVRLITAKQPKCDDLANLAWLEIINSFRSPRIGPFVIADKIAGCALASIGGIDAVGQCENKNLQRLKDNFMTTYTMVWGNGADRLPRNLPMLAEVLEYKKQISGGSLALEVKHDL